MLRLILKISTKVLGKDLNLSLLKHFAYLTRKLANEIHKIQFKYEWNIEPTPEWFDHFCDQYYSFRSSKSPLWLERGIFNLLAIKKDADVLDLCSGDGFYSCHFYSVKAKKIIALDFDKEAVKHANKYNKAPNINYGLCDIRISIPESQFDNIIWDAGIAHFSIDEILPILFTIKTTLKDKGVLSGYTIKGSHNGSKSLKQHEYEFTSEAELKELLSKYFKNVKVFETLYPTRTNLYFWASDDILPFDEQWENLIK